MKMENDQLRLKQDSMSRITAEISKIPVADLVGPPRIFEVHNSNRPIYHVIRYDLKRQAGGERRQRSIWLGRLPVDAREKIQAELDGMYQPEPVRSNPVLDEARVRILERALAKGRRLAVKVSVNTPFRFKGPQLYKRDRRTRHD